MERVIEVGFSPDGEALILPGLILSFILASYT